MSTRRVLVVDDDDAFRGVVAARLGRLGHEVRTAEDATAALRAATASAPDWILLDLRIGTDNGLALIEPLAAACPQARIVLATGYASIPTAVDAIRRGAWNYLAKPFTMAQLIAAFSEGPEAGPPPVPEQPPPLKRLEWEHIQRVLGECEGNITRAAEALGMHRRTLQRRLSKRPVRDRPEPER